MRVSWGRLDCYIGAFHPRQELWEYGAKKPCTADVFTLLKRKKSPLLQYFQVNFNARGEQEISVNLPEAFVGTLLNQIRETLNETVPVPRSSNT